MCRLTLWEMQESKWAHSSGVGSYSWAALSVSPERRSARRGTRSRWTHRGLRRGEAQTPILSARPLLQAPGIWCLRAARRRRPSSCRGRGAHAGSLLDDDVDLSSCRRERSTTNKPACEVSSAMHLLLRRAGGTEHALLALLAAPSIFAVLLSTKAAHSFVALARSCSRAHT